MRNARNTADSFLLLTDKFTLVENGLKSKFLMGRKFPTSEYSQYALIVNHLNNYGTIRTLETAGHRSLKTQKKIGVGMLSFQDNFRNIRNHKNASRKY